MICSLRFKKDFPILKILLYFEFCVFGFEAIPDPSCFMTSIVDINQHGPVITQFSIFFSYATGDLVSK